MCALSTVGSDLALADHVSGHSCVGGENSSEQRKCFVYINSSRVKCTYSQTMGPHISKISLMSLVVIISCTIWVAQTSLFVVCWLRPSVRPSLTLADALVRYVPLKVTSIFRINSQLCPSCLGIPSIPLYRITACRVSGCACNNTF